MAHELAVIDETAIAEITETSLQIRDDSSYEEWEALGNTILQLSKSINWFLGDWLNAGERKFGETYAQAVDLTGIDISRLQSAKWVSDQVPVENRRKELSWSHHHLASKYEKEEQAFLLDAAVEDRMTTREFKSELKDYDSEKLLLLGGDTFDIGDAVTVVTETSPERNSTYERVSSEQHQHTCPHCGHDIDP